MELPKASSFYVKSKRFFTLWGLPELASHVDIDFSVRLKTSWGRSSVKTRRVRLHSDLALIGEPLIDEVLCHELAHIAVYEKFGPGKRPHGEEWASLVRIAGFTPRVGLSFASNSNNELQARKVRYEHACPVCQSSRYARHPMSQWRCRRCVDAGLEGKLVIKKRAAL